MNGFINKSAWTICLTAGLTLATGCECYRNLVDPCYPERYESLARKEVCATFEPQVKNGRILDQTVWNYDFEAGTDKLNSAGQTHLAALIRKRPAPDAVVFLQTAQDIAYDEKQPEKFAEVRAALDAKRAQAVQKYLNAQTADRPVPFEVVVHDPSEPGMAAVASGNAMAARSQSFTTVTTQVLNTAPSRFPGYQSSTSLGSGGR